MKLNWESIGAELYARLGCGAVFGIDRYGNVLIHDASMLDVGVEIGEVDIYDESGELRPMKEVCASAEAIVRQFAEKLARDVL